MSDETGDDNTILNIETVETPENETPETLETEQTDEPELTQGEKDFKEKRREENRQGREARKELPLLKAENEKLKFFKSMPDAEDYEKEIDAFRSENPTVPLDKAFRYVLSELNPTKLAELSDLGNLNKSIQGRTAINNGEPSFSEQTGEQPANTEAQLFQAAQKEYAKQFG